MELPVDFPQERGAPEPPAVKALAVGEGDLGLAETFGLQESEHGNEATYYKSSYCNRVHHICRCDRGEFPRRALTGSIYNPRSLSDVRHISPFIVLPYCLLNGYITVVMIQWIVGTINGLMFF